MIKYVLTIILTFLAFAFIAAEIDFALWSESLRRAAIVCACGACAIVFLVGVAVKDFQDIDDIFNRR